MIDSLNIDSLVASSDSSVAKNIVLRSVEPLSVAWSDSLRALPEYTYTSTEQSLSIMSIIWGWIIELLREVFDGKANSPTDWIVYVFIATAVGVAIYLIRRDGVSVPISSSGGSLVRVLGDDGSHDIDFDKRRRDEEKQGNFRTALRFHYLYTLQQLQNRGRIDWRADRTDMHYISQMRNKAGGQPFISAISVFRKVWYGGATLNEEEYAQVRQLFLASVSERNDT